MAEDDECLSYIDKYKLVMWDFHRIIEKTKSVSSKECTKYIPANIENFKSPFFRPSNQD